MGKSSKPLKIAVSDSAMMLWPEIATLIEQGHEIWPIEAQADVILGPNCWLMDEAHKPYLDTAIKATRLIKYKEKKT